MVFRKSLLAIFLSIYSVVAWAAPGDLDTTFGGGDGWILSNFNGDGWEVSSRDVIQQKDGKLIAAGYSWNGHDYDFAIARYLSDGSVDLAFGLNGQVETDFLGNDDQGFSLIQQEDGKIVVAGQSRYPNDNAVALVRYNTDGSLDQTFGNNGKVVTIVGAASVANSMIQQTDGKIVIAGHRYNFSDEDFLIVRYNLDGSLDDSFNGSGILILNLYTDIYGYPSNDYAYAMFQQADSKLVIGGHYGNSDGNINFVLTRINADGSVDADFGITGRASVDMGSDFDYATSMAIQSDEKIILAGHIESGGFANFSLARFNADGSLDFSFGSNGRVITDIGAISGGIHSICVQHDNKIVAAGSAYDPMDGDFAVVRYNHDGVLDDTFGLSGISIMSFGEFGEEGYSVIQQTDGKLVVAGIGISGSSWEFLIARIESRSKVKNNLDADNDSDIITRSATTGSWTRHTIQNAAITGTGSMNAYTSSSVQYVAQLDANGDGDADILTRNTSTGAWYLHQVQSGAVTSTAPIYLYANLDQQFIGTGDFNGDGTDDVMLRSASGGYYTVFLLSNHAVSSTVFYNAWTAASSVPQGVGDFDGDGTDDLLVRRTSDNLYFIFKTTNGGTANNYCACNIWRNPDWTFQFAGDTNKDGIDDIVIRGTGATGDGFWWNFRMNNFASTQTTNLNTFKDKALVSYAASGDYNGDGHTDMLIRVNNGPVYVAKIVNGLVSGSTTLLSNLPSDQMVLK